MVSRGCLHHARATVGKCRQDYQSGIGQHNNICPRDNPSGKTGGNELPVPLAARRSSEPLHIPSGQPLRRDDKRRAAYAASDEERRPAAAVGTVSARGAGQAVTCVASTAKSSTDPWRCSAITCVSATAAPTGKAASLAAWARQNSHRTSWRPCLITALQTVLSLPCWDHTSTTPSLGGNLPRIRFFAMGCFLTAPGPRDDLRRPKTFSKTPTANHCRPTALLESPMFEKEETQ